MKGLNLGVCPEACESPNSANRVVRVAPEELGRLLYGRTRTAMLVTPVRLLYRLPWKVEIEVGRPPSRPSRSAKDHASNVPRLIVQRFGCHALVREQLSECLGCIPVAEPRACVVSRNDFGCLGGLRDSATERHFERAERVSPRLYLREQTVERRDVASDSRRAERVGLDEGCPRADKRVVDALAGLEIATKEDFDNLRDELP